MVTTINNTVDSSKQTNKKKDQAFYQKKVIKSEEEYKKGRRTKKNYKNWKTRFKIAIHAQLSVSTLDVSRLKAPIKKRRVTDWIKKARNFNMLPVRDSF